MSKELTPEEFTFHSFRHSQGDALSQLLIFRYFHDEFGIEPDLDPTEATLERYGKYLGQTSLKTHIQYPAEGEENATSIASEAFSNLREYRDDPNISRRNTNFSPLKLRTTLLDTIVDKEISILDTYKPWGRKHMGVGETIPDSRYTERLKKRVESGMASFLFRFGRDKKTTGIDKYDQMYDDLWKTYKGMLQPKYMGSEYRDKLVEHTLAVRRAEIAHLGRSDIVN